METKFGHDRKVEVSARAFTAALFAISRELTRFYLTGVYIEPHKDGGAVLVATNGHLLIAVHDKTGSANAGWICPVPAHMEHFMLANFLPRNERDEEDDFFYDEEDDRPPPVLRRKLNRIHFDGHTASLTNLPIDDREQPENVFSAVAEAVDGTFPDWRRVVPKINGAPPKVTAISGLYAGTLSRALTVFAGHNTPGIRLHGTGPMAPVLIQPSSDQSLLAVLMPVRDDDAEKMEIPAWATATP